MRPSEWKRSRKDVALPGETPSPGTSLRGDTDMAACRLLGADGGQRLLAGSGELVDLLLPLLPANDALRRLPGGLQVVLVELAAHGFDEPVLQDLDAILGRAFEDGEAPYRRVVG